MAEARKRVDAAVVAEAFGLGLQPHPDRLTGPCPVHGGDNQTAFVIFTNTGRWKCWSRGCDTSHPLKLWADGVGLAQGILAARLRRPVDRREAAAWVEKVCGGAAFVAAPPPDEATELVRLVGRLGGPKSGRPTGPRMADVRARLVVPSPYFLGRGFPAEVLALYGVGEPRERLPDSHRLRGRAIAPVADRTGEFAVGYTCRFLGECPKGTPKWYHDGFHSGHHLYGLDLAVEAIEESGEVVLVEGPADVWALRSHGVENAVATFGTRLLEGQQCLLEGLPVHTVVDAVDNDEAGHAGSRATAQAVARLFTHRRVLPPAGKDWGECLGAAYAAPMKKLFKPR